MSKEKQIEEMAKKMIEIQQNFNEYCAKPCRECELGGVVNCESRYKAEALYNAGYRKQSEGKWVVCGMFDDFFKCSLCGDMHPWKTAIEYNFCPNCGAKMKGG